MFLSVRKFTTLQNKYICHIGIDVAWRKIYINKAQVSSKNLEIAVKQIEKQIALDSQFIVKQFGCYYDSKTIQLNVIAELFTSGSLRTYRKQHPDLDLHAIKKFLRQILHGLSFLHSKGITHEDLSLARIYINGFSGEVKIGDLGLAKLPLNSHSLMHHNSFPARTSIHDVQMGERANSQIINTTDLNPKMSEFYQSTQQQAPQKHEKTRSEISSPSSSNSTGSYFMQLRDKHSKFSSLNDWFKPILRQYPRVQKPTQESLTDQTIPEHYEDADENMSQNYQDIASNNNNNSVTQPFDIQQNPAQRSLQAEKEARDASYHSMFRDLSSKAGSISSKQSYSSKDFKPYLQDEFIAGFEENITLPSFDIFCFGLCVLELVAQQRVDVQQIFQKSNVANGSIHQELPPHARNSQSLSTSPRADILQRQKYQQPNFYAIIKALDSQVPDVATRNFITQCLREARYRPTAEELLKDEFLQMREYSRSYSQLKVLNDSNAFNKQGKAESKLTGTTSTELEELRKELDIPQQVSPELKKNNSIDCMTICENNQDQRVKIRGVDADFQFLARKMSSSLIEFGLEMKATKGSRHTKVVFQFDPQEDTPKQLSKEMGQEFDLSLTDMEICRAAIKEWLAKEIPGYDISDDR